MPHKVDYEEYRRRQNEHRRRSRLRKKGEAVPYTNDMHQHNPGKPTTCHYCDKTFPASDIRIVDGGYEACSACRRKLNEHGYE